MHFKKSLMCVKLSKQMHMLFSGSFWRLIKYMHTMPAQCQTSIIRIAQEAKLTFLHEFSSYRQIPHLAPVLFKNELSLGRSGGPFFDKKQLNQFAQSWEIWLKKSPDNNGEEKSGGGHKNPFKASRFIFLARDFSPVII